MSEREGKNAVIVIHCAVMGRRENPVRTWSVGPVKHYAQYPVSVHIDFCEPRKRRLKYYTVTPDNLRYHTIESEGCVLYDSREDVPCDMDEWRRTREKHKARWLERKAQHEEFMRKRGPLPAGASIRTGYEDSHWEVE